MQPRDLSQQHPKTQVPNMKSPGNKLPPPSCSLTCPGSESESVSRSVLSDSCDPMDCSWPGSSVHGILQARVLEWFALPSSRGSSQPRDQTQIPISPALTSRFFTTSALPWKAHVPHQNPRYVSRFQLEIRPVFVLFFAFMLRK